MKTSPNSDEQFMELALQEARKGLGRTSPNPCVGAILVKENKVIASGYHARAGEAHAEIHALRTAGEASSGATMYVTLEPCSHTGKTPPCCHAVVESGVKNVVIGMLDPNPLVSGRGKQYLLEHGVEARVGVLEEQCRELNRPFIKFITSGFPLVVMKAGLSLDGRLNYRKGRAGRITGAESQRIVHQMRDRYDSILVGRSTVEIDNPSLTTRLAGEKGRDPVRIILDSKLSLASTAKVFTQKSGVATWVFCRESVNEDKKKILRSMGVRVTCVPVTGKGRLDLECVLKELARNNLTSVLVEGGGAVHGSFLESGLADRAHLFFAPLFAGSGGENVVSGITLGGESDAIRVINGKWSQCGEDMLLEGDLVYPA